MQKKSFRAAPGVAAVNGEAVPADGVVWLTDIEALYDLAHGNIAAIAGREAPKPRRRPRKADGGK